MFLLLRACDGLITVIISLRFSVGFKATSLLVQFEVNGIKFNAHYASSSVTHDLVEVMIALYFPCLIYTL